jgi:malate dehydrogenase (oxaloacetate-decarboxylating)
VCLDTTDTEEIIRTVQIIAPVYGGINLEDIAAPRCFEIERRLRETLDIPVFHDDQHGTAIVVIAALRNALRVVGKDITDCKIVVCGVGAAGNAIIRLLTLQHPADILAVNRHGIVHENLADMHPSLLEIAQCTNRNNVSGSLHDAMDGADVFIGVSSANLIEGADVARMNKDAIVFALANPNPEIDPVEAQAHAAVVATGRSDFPNQINNVLAFPGVFRGLLDVGATAITDEMLLAAAEAIADEVSPEQLNASFIVPSVFDDRVAPAVAQAIAQLARRESEAKH